MKANESQEANERTNDRSNRFVLLLSRQSIKLTQQLIRERRKPKVVARKVSPFTSVAADRNKAPSDQFLARLTKN